MGFTNKETYLNKVSTVYVYTITLGGLWMKSFIALWMALNLKYK